MILSLIKSATGRNFKVEMVDKGGAYGLNKCLTHEEDDPLIEFWDMSSLKSGMFVSRYYASTLLERSELVGLALHGREEEWIIGALEMNKVIGDLEKVLSATGRLEKVKKMAGFDFTH